MNAAKVALLVSAATALIVLGCGREAEKINEIPSISERVHPALRMMPVPAGLGVNIHFFKGNDRDLSLLSDAGIGIVRMDVSWGSAEKTAGQYDFSHYDQLIADLEQRGIRLLFIIDYGNSLYDKGLAPHTPEGRAASARFCAGLAERYAEKEIIWELWNEPNLDKFWQPAASVDDYMAWCKAVVPAIRQADPQACIVAPAVSSFDIPFLEACFQQGLLDLVDGITVHPYRDTKFGPETAVGEYSQLAVLVDQYKPEGKIIPILSGEWGYTTARMSRKLQGKYLPRQWLCNMAYGIPVSIWYDWHDDGQDPEEGEHNFGTVTWNYEAKPAYVAMKTLVEELRGFLPVGRLGVGDNNDYVVPFRQGDDLKLAVWTTTDPHEIDLGAELEIAKVVDYLGNQVEVPSGTRLAVDNGPRYLTLAGPIPNWLRLATQADELSGVEVREIAQSLLDRTDSAGSFSALLLEALNNGTERERQAAFHAFVQLANKLGGDRERALRLYHLVLSKNANVIDKKQALYGVAAIGSQESMEVVAPLLRHSELSQAAAYYYLQMAMKSAEQKDFDTAKKFILLATRVSQQRHSANRVLAKVRDLGGADSIDINDMAERSGFISRWWVAGPFPNANDVAERISYFPERSIDFEQSQRFGDIMAGWQQIETDNIWGVIPFARIFGRQQYAAYAYAEIELPDDMHAQFKIGSNDGVVCWVNGQKVHENLVARSLKVDEDVVDVDLERGTNRILLKVPNRGGINWEACLRICDQNGE